MLSCLLPRHPSNGGLLTLLSRQEGLVSRLRAPAPPHHTVGTTMTDHTDPLFPPRTFSQVPSGSRQTDIIRSLDPDTTRWSSSTAREHTCDVRVWKRWEAPVQTPARSGGMLCCLRGGARQWMRGPEAEGRGGAPGRSGPSWT